MSGEKETRINNRAQALGGTQGVYASESYIYHAQTGNLASKAGVNYGYLDTAHAHAVTHLNNVQKYWYDANGNQTRRIVGSYTYDLTYDAENRLIEVKRNGASFATFVYNGDGARVKSTIGGVVTSFVGNHLEWSGSTTTMKKYYYAGSQRVAVRTGSTLSYILGDHLGSSNITTDANGVQTSETMYKPWGEVRYTSGTLPTKYTFTGQYSNVTDFGLMYYNARWVDPVLGRFTQADTLIPGAGNPQSWDRYAYSNNNPVNYTDPTGHWSIPSFNFNSQQLAQDFTNWALDKTGLSNLGYTTSDVQQILSIAGTGLDVIAEGADVIAVGLSAAATVAGTALGAPEIGYGVGETLALPFLEFGNCMATGATISSLGSDLLTGDAGLELSVISSNNSFEVHGELSLGTSSTVGMITTGIGWIPGLPSYASLGLQSIAVANDFSLGQKIGIFNGTSYKIPIDISTSSGDQPYLNNNQPIPY